MTAWCNANQVTLHQLKYWLYKAKPSPAASLPPAATTNRFVPLAVTEHASATASSLVVRVGAASIELRTGFDSKLLRDVVQALQASC